MWKVAVICGGAVYMAGTANTMAAVAAAAPVVVVVAPYIPWAIAGYAAWSVIPRP